jgi:hypothetical protein
MIIPELLRSGRWDGELKRIRADGTHLGVFWAIINEPPPGSIKTK